MRILFRWVVWLLSFCGFVAFAVNYSGWFAHYLFYVFLALPILSLLLSLYPIYAVQLQITSPERTYRGQQGAFVRIETVRCSHFLQFPIILSVKQENISSADACVRVVRYRYLPSCKCKKVRKSENASENMVFSEETVASREGYGNVRVPIDTAHTAVFCTTLVSAYMTDFLGLFRFPVRIVGKKSVTTVVLPKLPADMMLPQIQNEQTGILVPTQGFSEQTEIRAYRSGDAMRSVHWKLTAKTDDVLVKEPVEHPQMTAAVTFDRDPDAQTADVIYDQLWRLLTSLCGNPQTKQTVILWMRADLTIDQADIKESKDLETIFIRILLDGTPNMPIGDADMAAYAAETHMECCYHITAAGDILQHTISRRKAAYPVVKQSKMHGVS